SQHPVRRAALRGAARLLENRVDTERPQPWPFRRWNNLRPRSEDPSPGFTPREARMAKSTRVLALVAVAAGGLLGYGAATGRLGWSPAAHAAPQGREAVIPFELLVPADAVVEIGGYKTYETGTERHYDTPPLRVGGDYTYTVKATWRGKEVT